MRHALNQLRSRSAGITTGAVVGGLLALAAVTPMAFGDESLPEAPGEGVAFLGSGFPLGSTWQDEEGGTLVLNKDRTFTSTSVCGVFIERRETGNWAAGPRRTGSGTWSMGTDSSPRTEVQLTFNDPEVTADFEVREVDDELRLWVATSPDSFVEPNMQVDSCLLTKKA
ncbi:hypothetical protein ACWGI8_17010 [Streptomyces sp. NPDC054841]